MTTKKGLLTILDGGGRYGVHPNWKAYFNFGPMRYIAFEPDPEEAQRLRTKYKKAKNHYEVHQCALMDKEGSADLYLTQHRGANSLFSPASDSLQSKSHLNDCKVVDEKIAVPTTTVDAFCADKKLAADVIKLDVQGGEYLVLQGATQQLRTSVVGVRAEVHFDTIYDDAPLFPQIMELMHAAGFYLVNIDYDGRGTIKNKYVSGPRYGVLMGCSSLWLKRLTKIESGEALEASDVEQALKQVVLSMTHHACDSGMDILLKLNANPENLSAWRETPLFTFIDISVQKLFRALRVTPGYDEEELAQVYEQIFHRSMKKGHAFFQSEEINAG